MRPSAAMRISSSRGCVLPATRVGPACAHGINGWQFGDALEGDSADEHDRRALYERLLEDVLPTYYDDRARWTEMMENAVLMAQERFSAQRMLDDYYDQLYRKGPQES